MKRFIFSILCVSVFFMGLGGLVKQVGARFKSDERAVALIEQARVAIGGDAAIKSVRSLTLKGRAAHSFSVEGGEKSVAGDLEINLALPNQFSRTLKMRHADKTADGNIQIVSEEKQVFFVKKGDDKTIVNPADESAPLKNKVVILSKDGANANVENGDLPSFDKIRREMRVVETERAGAQNDELARTMLALFLTAPEGVDPAYFYAGAGDVDGATCEIVEAKNGDRSIAKIYISKSSSLPLMISYRGADFPRTFRINRADGEENAAKSDVKVFVNQIVSSATETAEINVKFSDYRTVGGLQLPFVWTKSANGKTVETVSIDGYELNPADIAERFKQATPRRMMLKTRNSQ